MEEPMNLPYVRRGAYSLLTAVAVAMTGCGGDDPVAPDNGGGGGGGGGGGANPVQTTSVSVGDNFFNPPDIRVAPGATVTWTWMGSNPHDVVFAASGIDDSNIQSSGTFAAAMPSAAGTYSYECTVHAGMDGTVLVQ
jgi:plastocyanin